MICKECKKEYKKWYKSECIENNLCLECNDIKWAEWKDENLPIYPEGTEECIHCLGDGRHNNGILIVNCPQCGGCGYRKITQKSHNNKIQSPPNKGDNK